MSDERLEELGLERRAFLKKAALAGFVAPVIASFAFEGTAVAGTQFCGNQHTYPNQVRGQDDQGQNDNSQGQNGNSQS